MIRLAAVILGCGLLVGCASPYPDITEPTPPPKPSGLAGDSIVYDNILHGSLGGHTELTVGLRSNIPGLVTKPTGSNTYSGFEVAVVNYIANKLNLPAASINYKQESTSLGLRTVLTGDVNIYIGVTEDETKAAHVESAGPYFTGDLGVLYRRAGPVISTITDTSGKKGCVVDGSSAQKAFSALQPASSGNLSTASDLDSCVDRLRQSQVDFVVDYLPLLGGEMLKAPNDLATISLPGSSPANYVIAMPSDDVFRAAVNQALRDMIQDGSWQRAYQDNLGKTGIKINPPTIPN